MISGKAPAPEQSTVQSRLNSYQFFNQLQEPNSMSRLSRSIVCLLFLSALSHGAQPVITDEMYQRSIVSEGDLSRLRAVLVKAKSGKPITVAVIGGSITAGGAQTKDPENRYGNRVSAWFRKNFPKIKVLFVNAGIGGTNSYYGSMRLKGDVLKHNPDLVVVEFAVNNFNDEQFTESYEGLIRQLLAEPQKIAVIELFFMHRDGKNAQEWQAKIGNHYQLPMVSFRDAVWPELSSGKATWESLYADVVHPKDEGHLLAGGLLTKLLDKTLKDMAKGAKPVAASVLIPAPMISDTFVKCWIAQRDEMKPVVKKGWTFDAQRKCWESSTPASAIEFEIPGTVVFVNRSMKKELEQYVTFSVDGGVPQPMDGGAHTSPLIRGLTGGKHKIRVMLAKEMPAGQADNKVAIGWIGGAGLK